MLKKTQPRPTAAPEPETPTPPERTDFTAAVVRFRADVHRYMGEIDMRVAMIGRALSQTEAHHRRLRARREALENRKKHMARLLVMCGGPAPDDELRQVTASADR